MKENTPFKMMTEVVGDYTASPKYRRLSVSSKRIYDNGLETLYEHGFIDILVEKITRPMVIDFRDKLYNSPGKLKIALTTLNNLLKFAYDRGWIEYNHAKGVGDLPPSKPIERWSESEVDKFLSNAPPHLKDVMMVALYTGQRRSDLVNLRWKDYAEGVFHVKQRKTGIELDIPVHKKLYRHLFLEIWPRRNGEYVLTNLYGTKWNPDSMRRAINRFNATIGITGRSVHGIRKTTASMLAELGCSPNEIMSITGHQTLKEVTRYTQGAEKLIMAREAMNKWSE